MAVNGAGGPLTGFVFDLQFFAQERTEPATPRKRQKTRDEGKVCKSKDLMAAIEIVTGLLCLWAFGYFMAGGLIEYIRETVTFIGEESLFRDGWFYRLKYSAVWTYFMTWLFMGLAILVVVVGVTVRMVGWKVSFQPFVPKLDRMNPISGMKKIISLRSLVELLKGIVKAAIFGWVIYLALRDKLPVAISAMQLSLGEGAMRLWDLLWGLAMRLAVMLLLIGIADYWYQKWDFEKSIKMSKQEIKEEMKQMEGDPQIKSKIRQKQRELAKKRMMSSVPKADVVITNPTTLAVALMYDREIMAAPQVVAKGKGFIAGKIRELAEEHKIPIVENKPLAWALYESAEIGDEVPENLYRGVAEILAMVYKLKKKI
ncbi:MAG: flagellar biosynthesis protein FlhB [Synergistaceae bacterium]|nr:flagellar biosynthesis protein FlhB [Synergistaceae bacterium]